MMHLKSDNESGWELAEAFEKNSSELYWLAYLLTGNVEHSVEAFDRALDFDEEDKTTFSEFMNAWARKLVVVEALGTMETELRISIERTARLAGEEQPAVTKPARRRKISREEFEEAAVSIDVFPRCAMLLTIFEGMTLGQAAILLNADQNQTAAAQRIGIVQLTRYLAGEGGVDSDRDPGCNPVPVLSLG